MGNPKPTSRVDTVMRAVDYDQYVTRPDGTRLPQSSAPPIIATMLTLLDPQPGNRVLEIGTGSGYSTTLLAELVGDTGHITSIDIDPALVSRATALLAGHSNISVLTADGRERMVDRPVDRVIAWTTVTTIPTAWVDGALPSAVIVTPVNITGLATTHAILRAHTTPTDLHGGQLHPGGFVDATAHAVHDWTIPSQGVDVIARDTHGRPWWFSADWLRDPDQHHAGQDLLRELITNGRRGDGPLSDSENADDFYAWLLATRPTGLTTAALGDSTWHIGYTNRHGAAFFSPQASHRTTHTDQTARDHLTEWANHWREDNRPGWPNLRPTLTRHPTGWTVHATTRETRMR